TALNQIDKTNVGTLGQAWRTDLADDGEQEATPIVWNGIMYLSTPHDGVLALDAGTGKLLWQTPYKPAYVLLFAGSRGIGLVDGPPALRLTRNSRSRRAAKSTARNAQFATVPICRAFRRRRLPVAASAARTSTLRHCAR